MNHDIAHCRQIDCPLKDTCYRYIAYLEAQKEKIEYISVFKPLEKAKDQCPFYWKYEEQGTN